MDKFSKFQKLIIVCAIIMIGIIITIILLIILNKNNPAVSLNNNTELGEVNEIENDAMPGSTTNLKSENEDVKNLSLYKLAETKINKYLNDIYDKNSEDIIAVLNQEYKSNNQITVDNVFDKVQEISTYSEIKITKIKQYDIYGNYLFFVKGNIKAEDDCVYNDETGTWEYIEANDSNLVEVMYAIRFDFENLTYDIEPLKEEKAFNIDKIEVTENDYNTFEYKVYENYEIIGIYLQDFKEKISNNQIEEAYNLLDENYKKTRFGNLEQFSKYVQENKDNLEILNATKYKINEKDDCIEYILADKNNNFYIIYEYSAMNYRIALDANNISNSDNNDKYNDSSDQEKVGMNINKFINAVNQKDYQYVYNKLDETFKQNNYKTQEDLENYLKTQLYDNNSVNFEKFLEQGNNYIYKIKVINTNDESQSKEMTIVMQLKEGTDFVMSFSI